MTVKKDEAGNGVKIVASTATIVASILSVIVGITVILAMLFDIKSGVDTLNFKINTIQEQVRDNKKDIENHLRQR